MQLNYKKELTPVVFGETSVKILTTRLTANMPGFEQHWHDRIELHLVKSGCMDLYCDDRHIKVYPGELSIVSPGVLHSGKASDEGYECFVIMFEISDLFNGTVSAKQYIEPIVKGDVRFCDKTKIPQIVGLAEKIVSTQLSESNHHPLEIVGYLYSLLGLLCKHCIDSTHSFLPKFEKFDNVINYINGNFTKNISVADISKKFGYDESYFCRKFKKVTGITLVKYIRTQRLEHARKSLEKTNDSIRHIAISSGFPDAAYFTNCFKNMYGISPTKYRIEYIDQNK